jgi:hypothetical protein
VRIAERFPTWRARLGIALAFVGSALAFTGAYALSLIQTWSACGGLPSCKAGGPILYAGYVPSWTLVLIAVAGAVPLLVLLRPSLWWVGAACSLAVLGFFGEYYLYLANYTYIPHLVEQPWVVSLDAWVLTAAAVTSAVGMMLVRPVGGLSGLAPGQPAPSL